MIMFDETPAREATQPGPRIIASKSPGIARTQYRCTGCGCNVNPTQHKPGSADCESAYWERYESQRD